ncbi:hypothetical protein L0337_17085 [candidate division KSB1 bacterium]|nr:hypothetical protein [candidate division KSB1 bacterium]
MIRKRIKVVMIPHGGMFAISSLLHGEHCLDDTKLYFSAFHFSVLAFVQANLTLPRVFFSFATATA